MSPSKLLTLAAAFMITIDPLSAQNFEKGLRAYNGGDYTVAAQNWRPLAEQGDARAQSGLGFMYENGQGIGQNYQEAVRWYRRAGAQGMARAQFRLGLMFEKGHGVEQDYKEAARWYRRAAEQGVANAQYQLGFMYENVISTPANPNDGVEVTRLTRPTQAEVETQLPSRAALEQPTAEFVDLMKRLRTAVAARPDDLQGHRLLARNEMTLGNYKASYIAQQQVLKIKGDTATGRDYAEYGNMLILAAGGYVSPKAEVALSAALADNPEDGASLYYMGLIPAAQLIDLYPFSICD